MGFELIRPVSAYSIFSAAMHAPASYAIPVYVPVIRELTLLPSAVIATTVVITLDITGIELVINGHWPTLDVYKLPPQTQFKITFSLAEYGLFAARI